MSSKLSTSLRPILTDPAVEKVGQNIKYDMLALGRAGLEMAGPFTDTMVLSYLLESGERNHNLDQLSQRLLDHDMIPITDLIGKGKNQLRMDQVAVERVAEYAGEDADATWRIEDNPRRQGQQRGALGAVCRARTALDLRPGANGESRDRRGRAAAQAAFARVRRPDRGDRDPGVFARPAGPSTSTPGRSSARCFSTS